MAGFNSFRDIGLYSAAQTGLLGLCKGLAFATAKRGVRVNSVSLGMFKVFFNSFFTIFDLSQNFGIRTLSNFLFLQPYFIQLFMKTENFC
jgi:NAD(P)-dependent dehydrogenase (short-subunit alcohol dehydrogenase family)